MNRLSGKVAIITGANSGIGKATALLFAEEGASVVLAARRKEALDEVAAEITAKGGTAITVAADVSVYEDCKNVVSAAVEAFGRIDVLVNNAGMADKHRPASRCEPEWYDEIIGVNQSSVYYMCKEALVHMEKQNSGSIVNVSSIGAIRYNSGFAYTASKCAVIGMSRNLALQYAGSGIRINIVCPGPTMTALNTPDKVATFDKEFSSLCDRLMNYELGFPSTEDQAQAILFFASDEAKHVTGQTITVDNGIGL